MAEESPDVTESDAVTMSEQFRDYENVSLKGIAVVDQLSCGLYGPIWRVVLPTGERCVAKELVINKLFLKECSVHCRLSHPNIVRFLGTSQLYTVHSRPRPVYVLVTELLSMNLYCCKECFPKMPLSITVSILCDIAEGMAYLHSLKPPVVHGDLAPRHILLTDHMRAKISGFGTAQLLDGTPLKTDPSRGLDISFMPPEAFSTNPVYDGKLDVYSFGMLVTYITATVTVTVTDNKTDREHNFDTVKGEILCFYIRRHYLSPLMEQCLKENALKRVDSDRVVQILKQLSRKHPMCLKDILEMRNTEDVDVVSVKCLHMLLLHCRNYQPCMVTTCTVANAGSALINSEA